MWQPILDMGLLTGGPCLGVQAWAISGGNFDWQTMVFTVLTIPQMVHVMVIRSERESLWHLGLGSNRPLLAAVRQTFLLQMATIYVPALNPIFRTELLSPSELGVCLGAATVVAIAVEMEKTWRRRKSRDSAVAEAADIP